MLRCITCNVFHMRQFWRFFYCLAWLDTVPFNWLPCPNNEMYDEAVFSDRFRYQLNMFGLLKLIWLSRLIHAHNAYETDTSKIIASFFRIFYWLDDLIRLNPIVCHAQTGRCTMMRLTLIDSDINWRSVYIDRAISTPWYWCCIWNSYIINHHWKLAWCGKRSLMQNCSETLD